MTPKQMKIFKFIEDFIREHGFSPTLDEIASFARVCKVTARQYLQALERHGVISRKHYGHRSIEILEPISHRSSSLPLLGYIAAGAPIDAVEIPEELSMDEMAGMDSQREMFALKVRGDSMIDEGILDGDYVIIEKRNTAENGETVVALLDDGSATLKKFYREKGVFRLQPANEKIEPLIVESVTIQGVVKGVYRPV